MGRVAQPVEQSTYYRLVRSSNLLMSTIKNIIGIYIYIILLSDRSYVLCSNNIIDKK